MQETPSHLATETDQPRAEVFDAEGTGDARYETIDRLRVSNDGRTLRRPLNGGGSFLAVTGPEVHPAFSGQRIGARLLAQVLWVLARNSGDLAYLDAYPERTFFTPHRRRHRASPAELARLLGFYRRLGFGCVRPAEPKEDRAPVPMYNHLGASDLPCSGPGPLSQRTGISPV